MYSFSLFIHVLHIVEQYTYIYIYIVIAKLIEARKKNIAKNPRRCYYYVRHCVTQ